MKSIGNGIEGVQGHISSLADLDRLHDHIKTKYGPVDIIFANAGLGKVNPMANVSEEEFDQTFDVNVKGTFFTVQKLLPLIPDGGSIILNACGSQSPRVAVLTESTKAESRDQVTAG